MKPQFFTMLPSELQSTVQDAERVAGCEIEIVRNVAAAEFDNLTIGIDHGVCVATISHRDECISHCALLHEVLHIKRYWLEAVPTLRPTTRRRYEFEAHWVDELIEHLIIIPEERRFAKAESNAHWSLVMRNLLDLAPASKGDIDARRRLFVQRAMLDIALPDLDRTPIYDRLRAEDLLDASAAFVYRLRRELHNKLQALVFVVHAFGYDLAGFCVGRFNLRADLKSFERSPALSPPILHNLEMI